MRVDERELERLRENSGMRLDAQGGFWHEERPVEHPRVVELFRQGLGRAPDGRPTLRVGRTWCYIDVEDTLYGVERAYCTPAHERLAACELFLDDGTSEPLQRAAGTLALGSNDVLYARVKNGTEWARLSPGAQAALGAFLVETADGWSVGWQEGDVPVDVQALSGIVSSPRR